MTALPRPSSARPSVSHTRVHQRDLQLRPNFDIAQVGLVTRWTPVKNLTFSAETMYARLHQNLSGTSVFTPGAPQPTQTWTFHDPEHPLAQPSRSAQLLIPIVYSTGETTRRKPRGFFISGDSREPVLLHRVREHFPVRWPSSFETAACR